MDKSTRTAQLIAAARKEQAMSLRDFGAALGISHQQVKNYEAGQIPDGEHLATWLESNTPWVQHLGQQIFCHKYGALVQAVLRPGLTRYTLTPAGEKAGCD